MPSAEVKQTYHVHGDNSDPGSYRGKAEDQVLWLSLAFVAIAACCSSHLRPRSVREADSWPFISRGRCFNLALGLQQLKHNIS